MRPIVATWCAICSQKSFLRTSQKISEGIACSGNKAELPQYAPAHFANTPSENFKRHGYRF